ncbi:hypothetical protein QL285_032151 [Trifolium repens]|nr:hypothetical protein QL285_032151 [Trifolium repens]
MYEHEFIGKIVEEVLKKITAEDMGKDIVKQESPNPGERSRLWAYEDIKEVFKANKGTSKIEIIYLDLPSKIKHRMKTEWDGKAFKKMENLKTLLMNKQNYINQKHLPTSLRVLDRRSVWSWPPYKMEDFLNKASKFKNMRVLNFDDDRDLSQIPDLSRSLPKLEELSIQRCHRLYTIDKSVGFLHNLKVLRIRDCDEIKSVPPLLYCYSLVELDLSDCSELVTIDESVVDLGNLQILRLTGCKRINTVPPLYCPSLVELYLSDCFELESFSVRDGFGDKLKIMSVARCFNLRSIPPLKLSSLEELDLSDCRRLDSFPLMEDGFLGKIEILRAQGCHNLKSIPRLNLNSLKELNLSYCYSLESFPSVVDDGALLENIRLFNIEECILLKSIPPFSVTWLQMLNISRCLSLESFPEILGDMRNIPELHLDNIPKKLLPFPLQNLTPPHTLYSCRCGIVNFPNKVAEVSMLAESTIEVEGNVSPTESSLVEYICLRCIKLSVEYWSKSFMLFAKVKELHLINNEFTVLPKSMENCKFLWRLVLDDCVKLQEIKGIPPCLKVFSALNCQLLTSSSKSKLLNQKLHEAGNTWFRLPGAKIPEWFYQPRLDKLSISFWFRNKFPAIILCVYSPFIWDYQYRAKVIINGNTFSITHGLTLLRESRPYINHLHLFHLQLANFNDKMDNALLENKWNHAKVDFGFPYTSSGIHPPPEPEEVDEPHQKEEQNKKQEDVGMLEAGLSLKRRLRSMWLGC